MWLDKCTEPYKIRTICALTFVLFESGDCEGVRIWACAKIMELRLRLITLIDNYTYKTYRQRQCKLPLSKQSCCVFDSDSDIYVFLNTINSTHTRIGKFETSTNVAAIVGIY